MLRDCELIPVQSPTLLIHQRNERRSVHDLLREARASIKRVTPHELAACLRDVDDVLVADTRDSADRARKGAIPGSVHVPRTVLEWHLDPSNGYRHPNARGLDQTVVVVCNDGYSSSLATATLASIGFTDVADLIGGVSAWVTAGLPVEFAEPTLTPPAWPEAESRG